MSSRIEAMCPTCNAKLAVTSEKAGKCLLCPKCQATIQVPGLPDDAASPPDETKRWKGVVGTKKGGPFSKARLRQLVDDEKLPAEAFVRDEDEATDWFEVQTCGWLIDFPKRRAVRYCTECGCRVVISDQSSDQPRRCPCCFAPVTFADF